MATKKPSSSSTDRGRADKAETQPHVVSPAVTPPPADDLQAAVEAETASSHREPAAATQGAAMDEPVAPTIITALPDVPLEHPVPDFGNITSDDDRDRWNTETLAAVGIGHALRGRSHQAAAQGLAMMLMSSQLNSVDFFRDRLKEEGRGVPKSNNPFAMVAAYFLGLDVTHVDKKTAANASKRVNTYSNALRALNDEALRVGGNPDALLAVTFDEHGVRALVALVIAAGGITALSRKTSDDEATDDGDVIPLDLEGLKQLRRQLTSQTILNDASALTLPIAVKASIQDGSDVREMVVARPSAQLRDLLCEELATGDIRVRTLGEILEVGRCVRELPTSELVNRLDDPQNPRSGLRRTTRQFVLDLDGRIHTGPIRSDASVIVISTPIHPLFETPFPVYASWETKGRRRAEANLADPRRRIAFRWELGDVAGTQALSRVVIRTDVARNEEDSALSVGFLVQRTSGSMPLVVDAERFKATATTNIGEAGWDRIVREYADQLRRLKKLDTIGVEIADSLFRLTDTRDSLPIDAFGTTGSLTASVRADDLLAVAAAVRDVPILGSVAVSIAEEGLMRFDLRTELARYEIHIPLALRNGERSNRLLMKLKLEETGPAERTAD
jgi:hypothetical protein